MVLGHFNEQLGQHGHENERDGVGRRVGNDGFLALSLSSNGTERRGGGLRTADTTQQRI